MQIVFSVGIIGINGKSKSLVKKITLNIPVFVLQEKIFLFLT